MLVYHYRQGNPNPSLPLPPPIQALPNRLPTSYLIALASACPVARSKLPSVPPINSPPPPPALPSLTQHYCNCHPSRVFFRTISSTQITVRGWSMARHNKAKPNTAQPQTCNAGESCVHSTAGGQVHTYCQTASRASITPPRPRPRPHVSSCTRSMMHDKTLHV